MPRTINTGNALGAKVLLAVPLQENELPYTSTSAAGSYTFAVTDGAIQLSAPGPAIQFGLTNPALISETTPVTNTPFTLAVMARLTNNSGTDQCLMSVSLGDSDYWELSATSGLSSLRARARSGGSISDATISGGLAFNTWMNCAAVFGGNASRRVYLNGTLSAENTGSTPLSESGVVHHVGIGVTQRFGNQASPAYGAYEKYAVIFNSALTLAELDSYFANPDQIFASADTTVPTLTGSLTVGTVTSSSIQITWPAGSDNVAVTSYETSLDGSSWTDRGNVLTYTFTGLTQSTSYTLRVRAKDGAGNVSTPALQVTQSTTAAPTLTIPLVNNTNSPLLSTNIPHVVVMGLTSRTVALSVANQSTNGSGNLILTGGTLATASNYMVSGWNADGTLAFIVKASTP